MKKYFILAFLCTQMTVCMELDDAEFGDNRPNDREVPSGKRTSNSPVAAKRKKQDPNLADAITKNDANKIVLALEDGQVPTEEDCSTILNLVINKSDLDLLRAFFNTNIAVPLSTLSSFLGTLCEEEKTLENDKEIARLLLEYGANPNHTYSNGESLLHEVIDKKNWIIPLLIQHGATVNKQNSDGDTPLHLAYLLDESGEAIRLLLANGADETIANNEGKIPNEMQNRDDEQDE